MKQERDIVNSPKRVSSIFLNTDSGRYNRGKALRREHDCYAEEEHFVFHSEHWLLSIVHKLAVAVPEAIA